ncbi:hypothetical protein BDV93DRAFT_516161 [Ceratobasidium sp. AG-I]|nr:hypothetical protein BDV93DRAFT_516161 [Ceratobasidium sp. AG-I]
MSPLAFASLFSIISTLIFTTQAYPTELRVRQALADVSVPSCVIACASQIPPDPATCAQAFTTCLSMSCLLNDFNVGTTFAEPYCSGQGIAHTENGVLVTDVPPPVAVIATTSSIFPTTASPTTVIVTEYVTLSSLVIESVPSASTQDSSSTFVSASSALPSSTIATMTYSNALRGPAAIIVYVIVTLIILVLVAFLIRHWRRKQQGDYILPTHRQTRGKSFLIDELSIRAESIELAVKAPAPGSSRDGEESKFEVKLEDRVLPLVPIPTKDSTPIHAPLPVSKLSSVSGAVTHPPARQYNALPGRESGSPPGLDRSSVSESFAAGRQRALTNLSHSRSASPSSPSSSASGSGLSSPSTSSGDAYAAAARAPIPAYTYQPNAPSPLRAQLDSLPHQNPHPYPPMSVMHSTVTPTRHTPTQHSHHPRSADNLRQFTFPSASRTRTRPRESLLNETEMQITISEALSDGPPPSLPPLMERSESRNGNRSRSATPNSMHRGAGGSSSGSSMSGMGVRVQGKLKDIVVGMRRERE